MNGASLPTLIRRMWYGGRKGRSAERRLRTIVKRVDVYEPDWSHARRVADVSAALCALGTRAAGGIEWGAEVDWANTAGVTELLELR